MPEPHTHQVEARQAAGVAASARSDVAASADASSGAADARAQGGPGADGGQVRLAMYSGVLARQKAIVLGQFTEYKLVPHDKGFKLQTVVDWLRSQISIPVLTNLPYGHVATKVMLPVGATVELAVEGRDALLFWG